MRMMGLTASALLSLLMLGVSPASAEYNYPVCIRVFGDPTYVQCQFENIAQCKATASGRAAECFVDPYFVASPSHLAYRHHRHRHHHAWRSHRAVRS